jgi:hypothetical protein
MNILIPAIRKLEASVLKLYLVNTAMNSKSDKMIEFFSKMSSDLQGQPEWKDWFGEDLKIYNLLYRNHLSMYNDDFSFLFFFPHYNSCRLL